MVFSRNYGAVMLVPSRCLLVSVLACFCAATAPSQAAQTPTTEPDHPAHEKPSLRLKTATPGLYYDEVGRAIAKSFNNSKPSEIPRIEVVSSRGSAENIQTLGENTIPFAIVQSDVAHA